MLAQAQGQGIAEALCGDKGLGELWACLRWGQCWSRSVVGVGSWDHLCEAAVQSGTQVLQEGPVAAGVTGLGSGQGIFPTGHCSIAGN